MSTSRESDDLEKLFQAIGEVVSTWAYVEYGLDLAIQVAQHLPGAERVITVPPIGLKQKVNKLQDVFRRLPMLRPLKDEALRALAKVLAVKDRRHDLVHGALMKMKAVNGVYVLQSFDVQGGSYREVTSKFDLKKLPALRRKLREAVDAAMWLAGLLVSLFRPRSKPPLSLLDYARSSASAK